MNQSRPKISKLALQEPDKENAHCCNCSRMKRIGRSMHGRVDTSQLKIEIRSTRRSQGMTKIASMTRDPRGNIASRSAGRR